MTEISSTLTKSKIEKTPIDIRSEKVEKITESIHEANTEISNNIFVLGATSRNHNATCLPLSLQRSLLQHLSGNSCLLRRPNIEVSVSPWQCYMTKTKIRLSNLRIYIENIGICNANIVDVFTSQWYLKTRKGTSIC